MPSHRIDKPVVDSATDMNTLSVRIQKKYNNRPNSLGLLTRLLVCHPCERIKAVGLAYRRNDLIAFWY